MKKRSIIAAGVLATLLAFGGCVNEKKSEADSANGVKIVRTNDVVSVYAESDQKASGSRDRYCRYRGESRQNGYYVAQTSEHTAA